jgi:Bifunctional DNA primase/polymerase, N-terminal/Family of unknown function (DUF5906)
VLDIDPRNGGHLALQELEREFGQLPRTPKVSTGGSGFHYYLRSPPNQASWKLPSGIELKASGGQVVAPGSLHQSGKLYTWDPDTEDLPLAQLPDWLKTKPTTSVKPRLAVVPDEDPREEAWVRGGLEWKGEQFTMPQLEARARSYLRAMPPSISGKGGHDAAFRVACVLVKGFLFKGQDAFRLLQEWNVEFAKPSWSKGELLHKLTEASKSTGFHWGYILRGERDVYEVDGERRIAGKIPVTTGDENEDGGEAEAGEGQEADAETEEGGKEGAGGVEEPRLVFVISQGAFYFFPEGTSGPPRAYDQGLIPLETTSAVGALQKAGKSFADASRIVKKKRCVIVKDIRRYPSNERMLSLGGEQYLNPFWTLIPDARKGDCTNLLALLEAIGNEDGKEWLLNWAAYIVQNPNVLPGVAVVVRGDPGVGKSKLGEAIGLCRGVYATINNSAFHAQFNSRWADARFINAAEVMLADSKKEDSEKFKALITDPRIEYHPKYMGAYEIPNRIAWWLTSNFENPVLVPKGDRRFTVLDAVSPDEPVMRTLKRAWAEYEDKMHEWRELQAFKWMLLHHKVDIDAARHILINQAHREVQEASKSSQEAYCDLLEERGLNYFADQFGLQGIVSTEGLLSKESILADPDFLYRLYSMWCKEAGMGAFGRMRFLSCTALKRFPTTRQRSIKGVLYRLRVVPK